MGGVWAVQPVDLREAVGGPAPMERGASCSSGYSVNWMSFGPGSLTLAWQNIYSYFSTPSPPAPASQEKQQINTISGLRWRAAKSPAAQVLLCVLLFPSDQEETNRSQGLTTHASPWRGMRAVKELLLCLLEPFFKSRVRCRAHIADAGRRCGQEPVPLPQPSAQQSQRKLRTCSSKLDMFIN